MTARLFLLSILLLTTASFFWDDEEKQLRQLHQNGESALQKREFDAAKVIFEELLGRIVVSAPKNNIHKYSVDWPTYVDVAMRLASCYEELNEKSAAENTLSQLLAKSPPETFLPRIKLMKARISATRESPNDAYKEMRTLASRYPVEHWTGKDLSFFRALEQSLDIYYDELMAKGKRFLLAGFYKEAGTIYEEILAAIDKGCYPKVKTPDSFIAKKIRYRLAECYFLVADYEHSLSLLQPGNEKGTSRDKIDREMLYLSALCYKEKKEYEKALDLFQGYTHLGDVSDLDHYDNALFEIGNHYYQNGHSVKARKYFERLQPFNSKPGHLGTLYLARIYLNEGRPKEAAKTLASVMPSLNGKNPLRFEYYYLMGQVAYALGDFVTSIDFFERSLAQNNSPWWRSSLYHLGWCYLHLGDNSGPAVSRFFDNAEKCFEKILDDQAATLSLAQLYLLRYRHFGEQDPLDKLRALLQLKSDAFTLEGKLHALLLLAEGSFDYEQKEKIYAQATDEMFLHVASYAQGWYCRGLNHFNAGLIDPSCDLARFELAAAAFERAFRFAEKTDRKQAAHILKLEAKAHLYRNSPITSFTLLEKLLTQFEESLEEREETLYLRGLLASQLTDFSYFPLAEKSLTLVIDNYPKGKYRVDALYALGTLYYESEHYEKAKEIFLKLGREHPDSPRAAEGWLFAAEAAAYLGENPNAYRTHTYETYPHSEQAPIAFFRQFSYSTYMEGGSEAVLHLKEFATRFPDSPLQIVANYLIGIHEREKEVALRAFENVLSAFSEYQQSSQPLDYTYAYFNVQATLELASLYLSSDETEELHTCERLLTTLLDNFSKTEGIFSYPLQFQEGEFKLVHCYLKGGKEAYAQQLLTHMLSHYEQADIQQSDLLSQVWQELGKLSLRCVDYDTALTCFELAQECGAGFSTDDQKLTLWILQSEAFRGKKEYDIAMRLLSRVINTEAASPLRLKAMYLRAEIYELEGRPELAVRQLESTAKKGGEWALKAQEKLKMKYGLE